MTADSCCDSDNDYSAAENATSVMHTQRDRVFEAIADLLEAGQGVIHNRKEIPRVTDDGKPATHLLKRLLLLAPPLLA